MGHKYQQKVVIGTDANGKPIVKWAVGETQREFQEAVYRILCSVHQNDHAEESQKERFGEYAEAWMEIFKKPRLKGNTFGQYKSKLNLLIDTFGNRTIESITQRDIQQFLNGMEGMAESYVRDILNILRQILDTAVEDDVIRKNPAKSSRIVNPSSRKHERRSLTEVEKEKIVHGFSRIERTEDRMYLALLFYSGMRPGEVLGLRWEDIDRKQGVIHIRQAVATYVNGGVIGSTKTEAGKRDVPLMTQLEEWLEPGKESGLIFAKEDGKPYTGQMRKRMWERIRKQIGLEEITPYYLRHNMATMLREAEVDIKATQSIMGHANAKVTLEVYSHLTDKQIRTAAEKMEEYLEQSGG